MDFIPAVTPSYGRPEHLAPLVRALERIATDPIRAVISMPPRHGKTETILHFIAWLLRYFPTRTVGYVTYAAQLARSKSRRARLMATIAGARLAPDMQHLEEWRTVEGGGVLATGVGGPLTGHGLDVLIVDDPIKNRMEAESTLMRDRVWEWFQGVGFTRLEPGASALVVMARWHPDDLAGRLIAQGWPEIVLPGLDADENPLWPDRWGADQMRAIRDTVGEHMWGALYQGRPQIPGGSTFKRAWYEDGRGRYDATAENAFIHSVGRWISFDTALSGEDKEQNAYTAAVVGDLFPDYRLRVREVWRGRVEYPDLIATITALARRYNYDGKLQAVVIEDRASGTSSIQTLRSSAEPWLASRLYPFQPVGSKEIRADQASAWCANGSVLLPHPAVGLDWLFDFEDELFDFPKSTFKDQTDAFGQLIIYLEHYLAEGYRARTMPAVAA